MSVGLVAHRPRKCEVRTPAPQHFRTRKCEVISSAIHDAKTTDLNSAGTQQHGVSA
jgi:hypothetical protein